MRDCWKRVLAAALTVALVAGSIPTSGFAAELAEGSDDSAGVVAAEGQDGASSTGDSVTPQDGEEQTLGQGLEEDADKDMAGNPADPTADDLSDDAVASDADELVSEAADPDALHTDGLGGGILADVDEELLTQEENPYNSCSATARKLAKDRLGLELTGYLIAESYNELCLCADAKYKVGKTPKVNSLAVWKSGGTNSQGHVAFVSKVSDDGSSMYIEEGGYHANGDWNSPGQLHKAWVATSGPEYGSQYGGDLVGFIYLKQPNHDPVGYIESAKGGAGTITVTGVAVDPDNSYAEIEVRLYDAAIKSGNKIASLTTEWSGTFEQKITVSKRGSFTLYAYGVDPSSGKTYQLNGTKKIRVTEPKKSAVTSLADAKYTIRTKLKTSMALDVQKASKDNSANVDIYTWKGGNSQKFNVTKNSDDSYTLAAVHSSKAVEVRGASAESGANVVQYDSNGGQNQRWWLDKNSDGSYTLRNKNSGKVLEVKGTSAEDATNVQQYNSKGGDNQKWYFVPISVSRWSVKASNADYTGKPVTTKVTVTAGGLTLKQGTDYTLAYQNNKAKGTAAVTVIGKNGFSGTKTVTFTIGSTSNSGKASWKGPSSVPVDSLCAFTVKNGSIKVKEGSSYVSVTGPYVWAKKTGTATLALVDADGNEVATKKLKVVALDGEYEIQSAMDSGFVLDIQKASKDNSAKMLIYTRNNGVNQRYQFEKKGDGTYAIKCVHSGKYIDVQGGGTKEGQNVIQYTGNGKANQRWLVQVDAEGRVTFVSANSGMCFDVRGGKAVKGKEIIQWAANGGNNQKWVLNKK